MKNIGDTGFRYLLFPIERRKALRSEFLAEIYYRINGKLILNQRKMLIKNISQNGVLLYGDEEVKAGDGVEMTFKAPFADFREITITGIAVRIDNERYSSMRNIGLRLERNIYEERINSFINDVCVGYYSH